MIAMRWCSQLLTDTNIIMTVLPMRWCAKSSSACWSVCCIWCHKGDALHRQGHSMIVVWSVNMSTMTRILIRCQSKCPLFKVPWSSAAIESPPCTKCHRNQLPLRVLPEQSVTVTMLPMRCCVTHEMDASHYQVQFKCSLSLMSIRWCVMLSCAIGVHAVLEVKVTHHIIKCNWSARCPWN